MSINLTERIRAQTPLKRQYNYHYGKCVLCGKGLMKIWSNYFYCSACTTEGITANEFLERERDKVETK